MANSAGEVVGQREFGYMLDACANHESVRGPVLCSNRIVKVANRFNMLSSPSLRSFEGIVANAATINP